MDFDLFDRSFKFFTDERQWNKFIDFIDEYFLSRPAAIIALICLITMPVLILIALKSDEKRRNKLKLTVLVDYIFIILLLSVFNRDGGTRELRLYYDSWTAGNTNYHESNVILSLIDFFYFVPYGMLIRWQYKDQAHWLQSLCIVGMTGLAIELLQYVSARGVASIGDLTAYIAGGMVGVAVMHLFRRKRHEK